MPPTAHITLAWSLITSQKIISPREDKPNIMKPYHHLTGGLNWLSLNTCPKLCVPASLLSSHLHNPSLRCIDAAKQNLTWLSSSGKFGIHFTQGGSFTTGLVSWVNKEETDCTLFSQIWTNTNWGLNLIKYSISLPKKYAPSLDTVRPGRMAPSPGVVCENPMHLIAQVSPKYLPWMKDARLLRIPTICWRTLALPMFSLIPNAYHSTTTTAVEWSSGPNISKKPCHINIHEIAMCDAASANLVDEQCMSGHSNITDLFAKEFKSDDTFLHIAFQLLSVSDSGACYVESGIHEFIAVEPAAAAA
jgi:hypothetical protein